MTTGVRIGVRNSIITQTVTCVLEIDMESDRAIIDMCIGKKLCKRCRQCMNIR